MKNNKVMITLLYFVSVLVLFSFSGCSQSESAAADSDSNQDETVTIGYNRFLTQAFGPGEVPIDFIQAQVKATHPNIQVELNIMPDDTAGMRNAIAVWMNGRDGTVDIYGMDTPWVTEFGSAGWAVPLNGELPEAENFVQAGLETFTYDGRLLAIPFWGSVTGLYYRKDLLSEAGFDEPPATIEEMREMISTVREQKPGITPFVWPGGKNEVLVMLFSDFLHAFGGSYLDEKGQYAFNSPEAVEALEFMRSLLEEGLSPEEVKTWNQQEAYRLFVEGQALFAWSNNDLVLWLDDQERSQVAGKWGFAPSPARPEGRRVSITGGFGFAVNPYSDVPEAALKVMNVIAGRETQKNFALAWGPIQYYRGLYKDPEVQQANPKAERINALLPYAISRPPAVRYSQLSSILQQELHSALTGQQSSLVALEAVNRRAEGLQ